MIHPQDNETIYQLRTLRKDVGVVAVVIVAYLLGLLLFLNVYGRVQSFAAQDGPFRIEFPARWAEGESLSADVLVRQINPLTDSAVKTSVTAEERLLDPANPPTLQTLLDRRVQQRAALLGYQFIDEQDTMVDGEKAKVYEYAYVVQPIPEARRASLPVVVQAKEYIVPTRDRTFYITFAAPAEALAQAAPQFERMLASVKVK